jgi:hypothetical protein
MHSFELSDEVIMNKICVIRGQKVMPDRDLAGLYQVETKQLKGEKERKSVSSRFYV